MTVSSRPQSKPAPPPNYSSRRVQMRLLLLVFTFMTVLVMMERARDPALYMWMGFENQGAQNDTTASTDEPLDTRLRPQRVAQAMDGQLLVAQPPTIDFELSGTSDQDLVSKILLDAWAKHLALLSERDKWVFYRVLKHYRDGSPLSQDDIASWSSVLAQVDVAWDAYAREASAAVNGPESAMSAEEKSDWNELLEQITTDWQQTVKPPLESVFHKEPLTAEGRAAVQRVQAQLDAVALSRVEDDKVFLPQESDAWFRLLDELATRDQTDLEASAVASPSYTGLFRQTDTYRGKLVTIKGTVKRCDYVHAPTNMFGIPGYYLIWVRPANGPKSPIAVYSLEIPTDFPQSNRDDPNEYLNEEVQFTGFFFKRYAYRAKDGINTVPQLLAKAPRWEKRQDEFFTPRTASFGAYFDFIPRGWLVATLSIFAGTVAVIIAWVAYRRSNWRNEATARAENYAQAQVQSLEDAKDSIPVVNLKDELNELAKRT